MTSYVRMYVRTYVCMYIYVCVIQNEYWFFFSRVNLLIMKN